MVLADWMDRGEAPIDLWDVDIRRMQPFQANRSYLQSRVSETLGLLYADHFPYRQFASARGVFGVHQSTATSKQKVHVLEKSLAGKGPIGSCQKLQRMLAKKLNMTIVGVVRIGLNIVQQNIWPYGGRWGCLTCPALAKSN